MTIDEIVDHHLKAFDDGDVDEIMKDYDPTSVLITPQGIARGPAEIRPLFEQFLSEYLPPGSRFEVDVRHVTGEIAYIVWRAESEKVRFDLGTDTFVVRGGKIVAQTTAAAGEPKGEAPP